ncbi:hypothetical protein OD91_1529 [Lutibacter sp. Hel_I_33_5]|uniref:DUF6370 family protein n=1 Tax=Lutibacter sp. Hel_I_33_5 TaxID=1566289 RepID=UPI0011A42FDC|nr:DUF6370 family protein [Lutibacter sp. Hel_I_33_5]TVZ56247.1 hypothetical protein OD91_1529 [Lutibacter sp. Hel_I_33_5]
MKKLLLVFVLILTSCAEQKAKKQLAEVSCGQCKFGLESQSGCDLAIKIDDKAYFVDGVHIDDYGDAHDLNTGFCNVIRKAEVVGEIKNNRFFASSLKLVDSE